MRHTIGIFSLLIPASFVLSCDEETTETGPLGGSTSTTTQTGTGGTSVGGSGTAASGAGAQGAGGTGAGPSCTDTGPGEPNDQPEDAVQLLVLSDDDPDPWPTLAGVIAGPNDVDWYSYFGSDDVGAYVDPERAFEPGATDLTMCAFFWCTDPGEWGPPAIGEGGGLPHDCPPGTQADTADLSAVEYGNTNLGTAHGCCTAPGTTTFHLGEDFFNTFWPFGCPAAGSIVDDMMVLIRVSAEPHAPPDTCTPYVIRYHF